ncbi:DinB family protein [Paenibacillus sp. MBLB4367]|uniref:DinB family protein n=1 Tax=Paenibacillus sp. MBLB4367 TaxID=3384767 RepID=UPI0039080D3E
MSNKEQLVQSMEKWIAFAESLHGMDERTWTTPIGEGKWAPRDIVSHMMLWDRYYMETAVARARNGEPLTLANLDFEQFNREAAAYGTTKSRNELLEEATEVRRAIVGHLRAIPEEQYGTAYAAVDCKFVVIEYIADFAWHDEHHMQQIASLAVVNKP